MARKDLLASVTASLAQEHQAVSAPGARSEYAKRGASKSMMQSLDELAENSARMLDGETVISLDPKDLDGSFVTDRIGEDDEEYQQLKEAILSAGQSTPILVRPHPDDGGRYMIVFGHRRAKVARDLGTKVRAVIKPLADIEHVIAQGQENTARADLSFIEKALFARRLLQSGMSKDVVKTALTVDDTLLSRMLSVADVVPDDVLDALGSAKGVGRDRWEDLKKTVLNPAIASKAQEIVQTAEFSQADDKFTFLFNSLKTRRRAGKHRSTVEAIAKSWTSQDKSVSFVMNQKPKKIAIELTSSNAASFGDWLSSRLDTLYREFQQSTNEETGE